MIERDPEIQNTRTPLTETNFDVARRPQRLHMCPFLYVWAPQQLFLSVFGLNMMTQEAWAAQKALFTLIALQCRPRGRGRARNSCW